MRNLFSLSLKVFLSLLGIFALHRYFAFSPLSEGEGLLSWPRKIDLSVVGLLGDLWVSSLGALGLFTLMSVFPNEKGKKLCAWIFVVVIAVLIGLHQAYTEFFKIQVIPQHLTYFGDLNFIGSNGQTFFNWQSLLIVAVGVVVFFLLNNWDFINRASIKAVGLLFALVLVVGIVSHVANIFYRVQHFVPENLQTNMFERLYLNAKLAANPPLLSSQDVNLLKKFRGFKTGPELEDPKNYESVNLWPVEGHTFRPVAIDLKKSFQNLIKNKQKVILLTILWESGRPSEMGIFQNDSKKGVTPRFDAVASSGIFFSNAHSTGTVTRGAQESSWCGHLSSQMTSFMRDRREINRDCLPRILKNHSPHGIQSSKSFWFHGGVGEFDSQEKFWRQQGTDMTFSQKDYAPSTAKTGWGVGDRALFEKSNNSLAKMLGEDSQLYFGMILTVTNHTPWKLPDDAPSTLMDGAPSESHPSYATTRYTDLAIGEFIDHLRDSGLWKQMLILVVSDHGNAINPLNNLYDNKRFAKENLFTHVAMAMTGGIVEDVLKKERLSSLRIDDSVSQADIAPWYAYLLDMKDEKFLGEPLLVTERFSPVISDLGYGIYFPQEDFFVARKDLLESDLKSNSDTEKSDILYYRSFLHLLNRWGIKKI